LPRFARKSAISPAGIRSESLGEQEVIDAPTKSESYRTQTVSAGNASPKGNPPNSWEAWHFGARLRNIERGGGHVAARRQSRAPCTDTDGRQARSSSNVSDRVGSRIRTAARRQEPETRAIPRGLARDTDAIEGLTMTRDAGYMRSAQNVCRPRATSWVSVPPHTPFSNRDRSALRQGGEHCTHVV
jgi:hypothetical protein